MDNDICSPRCNPSSNHLSRRSEKFFAYALLLIVGLVSVTVAMWRFNAKKMVQQDNLPSSLKVVSNVDQKNSAGIVLPTPGFPLDLLIEPNVEPIINRTDYSADGKITIATRSYLSQYDLYGAYQVAKEYLQTHKNWQITEIVAPNKSQNQTELEFSAIKNPSVATINFKQVRAHIIFVTIRVKLKTETPN